MDSSSLIDNVQSFVQVITNKNNFYKLIGREVKHFFHGRAKVNAVNLGTSEIGIYYLHSNTKKNIFFRYYKQRFLQEFGDIYPPFSIEEMIRSGDIDSMLSIERIHELIQIGRIEKQNAEIQEIKRQEAEILEKEKREARKKETARQKIEEQETEKRKAQKQIAEKQVLLMSLINQFEQNFLKSSDFYYSQCIRHISVEEYKSEKSNYVQSWIKNNLNTSNLPDIEQAAAIGAVEGHVQVVARAGSGKTSTLVYRALFLQKHCGVAPHEMLLLAFNRKAAEEIKKRLTSELQDSTPHVMTFHALAYALVHPEESILFDEPDGQQTRSRALQKVIDEYLQDTFFYEKIRVLMMAHFRQDWERLVSGGYDKNPEEMLRYRRSLPREGIDGTYVKSYGEKVIADFLFENNISYKYERNFWWNGINYRPDFTISTGESQGVVIEYFGLEGDPDYDAMSEEKRNYWDNKPNWHLIELTPSIIKDAGLEYFLYILKQNLEYYEIKCDRLSEEEIWQRIKTRAIDRFTKVVVGFTQRCRKLSLTPEKLAEIINSHRCISEGEQQFLELAQKFYQSYLEYLESTGEDDFDGLMQKATAVIKSGQTIFRRKSGSGDLKHLRYVFIDEYQDFSELFYNLITAVREQNSQACFFCVGDDWQAINGFAGSDLRFYQKFANFFQPWQKLYISTNYRSAVSIVNIGNKLMQGFGNPARANQSQPGKVEVIDLEKFEPTYKELEEHPGDRLTPAILRLVDKAVKEGKNVVLLCRKNILPWDIRYSKKP